MQGNQISDSTGSADLGVKGHGVLISDGASSNHIGGEKKTDANTIKANQGAGVFVESGAGNSILHNVIFANAGLGIDLGPEGRNENQPRKVSGAGPNKLQNFPVLEFATTGKSQRIVGTLESGANTSYTIEIFAGLEVDESRDDALQFATSFVVTTNASGVAFFDIPLPADAVFSGGATTFLIATATDAKGNTSEFCPRVPIEQDSDGDGVPDSIEDAGPFNDPGANVATVRDAYTKTSFITLSAPEGTKFEFRNVRPRVNPSPDDAPLHTQFGLGFFSFEIVGLSEGQAVEHSNQPAGHCGHPDRVLALRRDPRHADTALV